MENQRVHATTVTEWVNQWGPLITLASSVILAAVTGWLAYVTKLMATSAHASAEQSRIAAEASLASVAAAEASIEVEFDIEPQRGSTVGAMRQMLSDMVAAGMDRDTEVTSELIEKVTVWRGVSLTCRGATVTVHGLQLTYVGVEDRPASRDSVRFVRGSGYVGLPLEPSETLPRLCHAGETVEFETGERPFDENIVEFHCEVSYAIGNGPIRTREVRWEKSRQKRPSGAGSKPTSRQSSGLARQHPRVRARRSGRQ